MAVTWDGSDFGPDGAARWSEQMPKKRKYEEGGIRNENDFHFLIPNSYFLRRFGYLSRGIDPDLKSMK